MVQTRSSKGRRDPAPEPVSVPQGKAQIGTTAPGMDGMWSNASGVSRGLLPFRRMGPLFIIALFPFLNVFFVMTLRKHKGSIVNALQEVVAAAQERALFAKFVDEWPSPFEPTAVRFLAIFMGGQLLLMRFMPGKTFRGPITQMGNVPVYLANGFQSWTAAVAIYAAGVYGGAFPGGIFYDVFPEMLSLLNVLSFILCTYLYIKGCFFPSTTDAGTTGNPIFDFYEGVELYPRILGWDVKQFINCRFGMMYWGIAPISFALKQQELYGEISDSTAVSLILQFVYVSKFFWWETGYFETIDIMHDRGGFMLLWGCMNWVPMVYTITSHFLVEHPLTLGPVVAGSILGGGLLCVVLNYLIDEQRQRFRRAKGQLKIWGKDATYITAQYSTEDGKLHTSYLLTSGWWGLCRKFNYTLELSAALSWSLPAMFTHFIPYAYFVFLLILLIDRAYRDDARCRSKYGAMWDEYCKAVPYMLIPGIL